MHLRHILIEVYSISVEHLNCKKLIACDKYTKPKKKSKQFNFFAKSVKIKKPLILLR